MPSGMVIDHPSLSPSG